MSKVNLASKSSSLRSLKETSSKRRPSLARSHSHADARPDFAMAMRLKMVLGMTYPAGNCITIHPASGICAYTASNTVVLFDTIDARQIGYLKESKKPLGTVDFSQDGKMIVTGASGHMPPVSVWDVNSCVCIGKMYGHEYAIKCVAFAPKGDLIVSIGDIYDGFIYTWLWPKKEKLACNRFAEEIVDVAFSPDDTFFVTCGDHHIKFWYPDHKDNVKSNFMGDRVLYGRPAILGSLKLTMFVSVVCGTQRTSSFVYIISSTGHLAILSSGMRDVIRMITMRHTKFSSLCVHDDLLIVATKEGHVYLCNALSLEVLNTLSPSAVHCCIEEEGNNALYINDSKMSTYLCYDHVHNILSVFSTGGKLTVWDVSDPCSIVKKLYIYNHCGGITGSDIKAVESSSTKKRDVFVTVSCDSTVRLWSLDVTKTVICDGVTIVYTDVGPDSKEVGSSSSLFNLEEKKNDPGDLLTATKVSNEYVVTGDSRGNVVAYSLNEIQVVAKNRQHFRGVTCLEIFKSIEGVSYLLSGGKDRRIVLYELSDNLKALRTMSFHSGSITVLKVYVSNERTLLVSGGLDRSVVVSVFSYTDSPRFSVHFNRCFASSVMDCLVSPEEPSLCLGTLNGEINVFHTVHLSPLRSFAASPNVSARLDKMALNSRGNLLLVACSDRTINIINYFCGTVLSSTRSPSVSGLHFSVNSRCVVSASTDGCIFIWGLSFGRLRRSLMKSSSFHTQSGEKRESSDSIDVLSRLDSSTNINNKAHRL